MSCILSIISVNFFQGPGMLTEHCKKRNSPAETASTLQEPYKVPVSWHEEPHADFRGRTFLRTAEDDPPSPAKQGSSLPIMGARGREGREPWEATASVHQEPFWSWGIFSFHVGCNETAFKGKEAVPHQLCLSLWQG